ncbi:MAG: hypothetical protein QF752_08810 [Planctomycetota bacterium]|jgi:hypothetical protein|nr:hypothetical protein [Planctomycetota bacterium]
MRIWQRFLFIQIVLATILVTFLILRSNPSSEEILKDRVTLFLKTLREDQASTLTETDGKKRGIGPYPTLLDFIAKKDFETISASLVPMLEHLDKQHQTGKNLVDKLHFHAWLRGLQRLSPPHHALFKMLIELAQEEPGFRIGDSVLVTIDRKQYPAILTKIGSEPAPGLVHIKLPNRKEMIVRENSLSESSTQRRIRLAREFILRHVHIQFETINLHQIRIQKITSISPPESTDSPSYPAQTTDKKSDIYLVQVTDGVKSISFRWHKKRLHYRDPGAWYLDLVQWWTPLPVTPFIKPSPS